nr:heterogeneous nuclear ribonucleoprotein 1-like [Ipomoea trifida]
MDSDQGKLFIGGISWETDEDKLKDYFQHYGEVIQTVVMRDKVSGKPRGFGFVVFADPSVLDAVLQDRHTIDGRTVEAKRALSREEQQSSKAGNVNSSSVSGGGGGSNNKTKKIFVGGLPPTLTDDEFRQYFETYGNVTDVVIMYDQQTNRPRGFGFISFDSEDAVDRVLHKTFHDLNDKQVEVKRAFPKDANPNASGRSGGGGNYQGYGASGNSPYGNKMDSNRYMASQNTGGGYPSYGSSGYGTPGYGYPPTGGMGYGGYGSYGGANPGYGNANTGYGGLSSSPYGNPNAPNSGYGSGPAGGPRSSWSSQSPSGYGNVGYGSAPWGNSNAASGGGAAAGQSVTGVAGYGSQGYGYSGFGGNDGAYGNPSAYGSIGRAGGAPRTSSPIGGGAMGELQSGAGGYGGYGNAGGNSGYGSAGWRPDIPQASGNYGSNGSHGGQVGYGSSYSGSMPGRQSQQHYLLDELVASFPIVCEIYESTLCRTSICLILISLLEENPSHKSDQIVHLKAEKLHRRSYANMPEPVFGAEVSLRALLSGSLGLHFAKSSSAESDRASPVELTPITMNEDSLANNLMGYGPRHEGLRLAGGATERTDKGIGRSIIKGKQPRHLKGQEKA